MRDKILQLRKQGKTYSQIQKELKCSKSTISYYLGVGQKEKMLNRQRKLRNNQHFLTQRVERFKQRKFNSKGRIPKRTSYNLLMNKIHDFNRKRGETKVKTYNFTLEDVIAKIGPSPICYLTGEPIDINKPRTYQFDHIIPASRGGDNSLDNLGICTKRINQAKRDLTPEEFIELCKSVLVHNGYSVSKTEENGVEPSSI